MPVAGLLPALIGAGTSIVGGALGSRAAKNAAQQQQQAAQQAAARVEAAGNQAAAGIDAATEAGAGAVQGATQTAVGGVNAATQAAQQGAIDASGRAIAAFGQGANEANTTLRETQQQQQANLDPYLRAGAAGATTLAQMLAPGGQLTQQFAFTPTDLRNDPGYQFQLEEGQRALERSAAARGVLSSGGTLRGLARFSQGLADTTYGNAFDRALRGFQANRAATLDTLGLATGIGERSVAGANQAFGVAGQSIAGNQMTLGRLTGDNIASTGEYVGNVGMTGATQAGQFGMSGATTLAQLRLQGAGQAGNFRVRGAEGGADYLTDGAQAGAAGTVGAANAWSGAITNAGQAAADAWASRRSGTRAPATPRAANSGYDARLFPRVTLGNFTGARA